MYINLFINLDIVNNREIDLLLAVDECDRDGIVGEHLFQVPQHRDDTATDTNDIDFYSAICTMCKTHVYKFGR